MAVHLGRRAVDASAGLVGVLPDGLAGRDCPELCQARVRGCPWALADALEPQAVLREHRAQLPPDASRKAVFPFLARDVAAEPPAVVAAAEVALLEPVSRFARRVPSAE
jgi:hypothetical protein